MMPTTVTPPTMPGPDPLEAARAARRHATNQLVSAVEQGRQVRQLVERVQEQARENRIGEDLETIWQGRA